MSVHQTTDGRWFVRYPKGKNELEPDRTREYFGRGHEAEAKARQRNDELGLGTRKEPSPLFEQLVLEYVKAKAPTMPESSKISLAAKIDGVILPRLGHMRAMEITPSVLDRYVANRRKTVKITTIHRDLSDIRAILRFAVKRKWLARNPMEDYVFPRRDDEVIEPPSQEEIELLLKHSAPHLVRAIVLSYYTGLRPGAVELLEMRWHAVNLTGRKVVVKSADKGGLRKRVVPITDAGLYAVLEAWLEEDRAAGKTSGDCIVTYRGKPIASLKSAWQAAKKRAKITRRIRMYDIRHAFATNMLDNGADLKHVSILLGHKSVQQTVDTYQHTSKRLAEEALQKLPSILSGNLGNTGNTSEDT